MATTAAKTTEKILAYDGDCPMCMRLVALLIRARLVTPEQAVSNHVLAPDDFEAVRAAGIRNQLVVLDAHTRETRSGTAGLLWIIGENRGNPIWIRLLRISGPRHLLDWGYQTISYNRRVISPPRTRIVCDCEPEVTVARRMSLVAPVLMLAAAMLAGFGAALAAAAPWRDALAGLIGFESLLAVGWIALAVAAVVVLKGEPRIDYLAHLVVTLFIGSVVLLPATMLVAWMPTAALVPLVGLSLVASYAMMWAMQRRRTAAIGLSKRWLWAWAGTIGGSWAAAAGYAAWQVGLSI